ncbi:MAG: LysM peptidoglycan-binding domain-containing protein [Candidatus Spyradenecus sp.]
MKLRAILLLMLGAAVMAGCDRNQVAEQERRERADALFAEALAAEEQGNISAAEALYEQLLQRDASLALAHLNLAMLQHDSRKEYIEAIHHYRMYLALQPKSEKAPLVQERLAAARTLLAAQLAAERIAIESRAVAAERDELRTKLSAADKRVAEANKALDARTKEMEELKRQVARLTTLVETLKSSEEEAAKAHAAELAAARKAAEEAKQAVEAESEPTVDDEIAAVRADALRMIAEEDGGIQAQNAATREAIAELKGEETISATPTPGKRYLVRPGDTLSKLSREAYGNAAGWTRIRDANRSTTNPDGRLRAGETVIIP